MKKVILGLFSFLLFSVGITSADGIYHNSELGLISVVSGGQTIYTLQDKNIGATCTDIYSGCSVGCFFQYGNNYCFQYGETYNVDNGSYDYSVYSPSTFSSSSVQYNIDVSSSNNLWGLYSDNLVDQKGPCDTGYHIPLNSDYFNIDYIDLLEEDFNYYYLPFAGGYFNFSNGSLSQTNIGFIRFLSISSSSDSYIFRNTYKFNSSRVFSENKYYGFPVRCFKNTVVDPDNTWTVLTGDEIVGSVSCNFIYGNGLSGSFTPDQTLIINGYSILNGNTISPYFNISYTDQDNQVLTESYDKTNLILGGKFEKTYTGGENNFWVLTALGSSTIPDIIFTGSTLTGSSNISGNIFTNFVDNSFDVIGTNIPNFISYGFVLIVLIILIRLIKHFKKGGKGRI